MGDSMRLGGGGRFKKLEHSLAGHVDNPGAVAASIGRKKYGAEKMASMAAHGHEKSRQHEASSKHITQKIDDHR